MGTTFKDSDRLNAMIYGTTEYDEKNQPIVDKALQYHFEKLSVKDMLDAQRRAISGSTGGGGGTSGGTINTEDESGNDYSEWENIVDKDSAETIPMNNMMQTL